MRTCAPLGDVLPTRVGMVRAECLSDERQCRSPHARGDGPLCGWLTTPTPTVLPTRVGMVRGQVASRAMRRGSPHARGDGPAQAAADDAWRAFSPRAWGWSAARGAWQGIVGVLPTRVGMVRSQLTACFASKCSPHARGDGPLRGWLTTPTPTFSPRAWGWSAQPLIATAHAAVLPTRVGMVRDGPARGFGGRGSPHARGDGPPLLIWMLVTG